MKNSLSFRWIVHHGRYNFDWPCHFGSSFMRFLSLSRTFGPFPEFPSPSGVSKAWNTTWRKTITGSLPTNFKMTLLFMFVSKKTLSSLILLTICQKLITYFDMLMTAENSLQTKHILKQPTNELKTITG